MVVYMAIPADIQGRKTPAYHLARRRGNIVEILPEYGVFRSTVDVLHFLQNAMRFRDLNEHTKSDETLGGD